MVSQQDCNNDMELGKATSITGDRALTHSQHGPWDRHRVQMSPRSRVASHQEIMWGRRAAPSM